MVSFHKLNLKNSTLTSLSSCEINTEFGCLIELCDKSSLASEDDAGEEKKLAEVAGLEICGAEYGNTLAVVSENEEFGLIGTLNSGFDEGVDVISYNLSAVLGRMAGCLDNPGVGSEILVAGEDVDDSVEGIVREVDAEVAESNDCEGETVGGREKVGAAAGVSVMGSPKAFTMFRALVKSSSLWNFS